MNSLDLDIYLEMLQESYETLRESTMGDAIPEHEVEKRCDEAIDEHDEIGEIDNPKLNAAIIALAITGDDAIEDTVPDSSYESGSEYLAAVAHTTAKYDMLSWALDERAEAERDAVGDAVQVGESP